MDIAIKRIYADPAASDGYRVLVDRLWPRGVSKERADLDDWAKDVAPSTALREWFHADRAGRWEEFTRRYRTELDGSPDAAAFARALRSHAHVTFLIAAHDTERTHADVLRTFVLDTDGGAGR